VYVRALNKTGGERVLLKSNQNATVHDWSRDGKSVLFSEVDPAGKTVRDIWILSMEGQQERAIFIRGPLNQDFPRFSPRGRLVSYQSDDSGRNKVYVVPRPQTGDKWEISPEGGIQPLWRADGKELFYIGPDNTIMAVDVHEGPSTIQFGTPRRLFQVPIAVLASRQPSWMWDVAADGKKFLITLTKDDPAPLTLVTGWRADLKRSKD
jgi:Tol biopolymer transport system component